jgi:diguanylate cyclase (GGDEF)-like protein
MLLERHIPTFIRDAHRALDLAEQASRLAEDAAVDPLTHLANRRMLGRALGRLRPENTVIMIDLDHFKAVNDTFGHEQGDSVLQEFGHALALTLRATDKAGRYGGEEFVVILNGNEADPFLERLRSNWTNLRPHPVTFSAGVASARQNPHGTLGAADRAMYRAKESGRNQWQWATEKEYG